MLDLSRLTVEIGLVDAVLSDAIFHFFQLKEHKAGVWITITMVLDEKIAPEGIKTEMTKDRCCSAIAIVRNWSAREIKGTIEAIA